MRNEKKSNLDYSKHLDKSIVKLIEDTLQSSNALLNKKQSIKIEANINDVFCSLPIFTLTHPDPTSIFYLYDRVINTKPNLIVPVGIKGIVINIEEGFDKLGNSMITVCFDEEFAGGKAIDTKGNRAFVLPQCYLMNISHGKVELTNEKLIKYESIQQTKSTTNYAKEQYAFKKSNSGQSHDYYNPNENEFGVFDSKYLNANDYYYYDYNYFNYNHKNYCKQNYYQNNYQQSSSSLINPAKHYEFFENLINKKPNQFEDLNFIPTSNLIKNSNIFLSKKKAKAKPSNQASTANLTVNLPQPPNKWTA